MFPTRLGMSVNSGIVVGFDHTQGCVVVANKHPVAMFDISTPMLNSAVEQCIHEHAPGYRFPSESAIRAFSIPLLNDRYYTRIVPEGFVLLTRTVVGDQFAIMEFRLFNDKFIELKPTRLVWRASGVVIPVLLINGDNCDSY